MESTSEDIYRSGAYVAKNADLGRWDAAYKAAEIAKILARNDVRPASVCDVGCGSGDVLANLATQIPSARECVGYDVYDHPQAWAAHVDHRLSFRVGNFATSDDQHYDLLMLIDVIEHLEDPFTFVRQIASRARWFVFHIPLDLSVLTLLRGGLIATRRQVGHLHWFTKPLAEAFLADTGFSIVDRQLTAASLFLKPQTMRAWAARYPRKLTMRLNPELTAVTLGGTSLMVLTVADTFTG